MQFSPVRGQTAWNCTNNVSDSILFTIDNRQFDNSTIDNRQSTIDIQKTINIQQSHQQSSIISIISIINQHFRFQFLSRVSAIRKQGSGIQIAATLIGSELYILFPFSIHLYPKPCSRRSATPSSGRPDPPSLRDIITANEC